VKFVDANSNYKIDAGDKLELTYDQQIVISGVTKDDFTLVAGTGSAVTTFGTGATFAAGATSNQLVITLGTGVDISFGNTITPVATPHIKSLTGVNALASAAQTIASPDATLPAITKAEYEDTNADGKVSQGDRVVLTFSKAMDRAIAASDLLNTVSSTDGATVALVTNNANVALGAGASAEWLDATTMRITLGASPNLNTDASIAYLGTATKAATLVGGTKPSVKDLWGNKLATATAVPVEKTDKVRPTIQSVAIKAAAPTGTLAAGDQIVFTMSEAVNVEAAAVGEISIYVGPTATATDKAGTWVVSGTTVTYTIDTGDAIVGKAIQDISTITISPTGAAKIKDASGNTTVIPTGFGLVPTVSAK
jgi:hypothetical protein